MSENNYLIRLGEKIKVLRTKKGYTQEELAKKMGYTSRSTINKIEKGLVDIPQSKIVEFANLLNTTPLYLIGWTDNPDKSSNEIIIKSEKYGTKKYNFSNEDIEEIIDFIEGYFDEVD